MTVQVAPSPVTGALVVCLAVLAAGCAGASTTAGDGPTPAPAAPNSSVPMPTAPPTTAEEVASLRDGDNRDIDELAVVVAADAAGDPEWIEVFARLRASSWLWSRYPGTYDVRDIYSDHDAGDTARANEVDWLEHGVYLDEPLPELVSVVKTRTLGQLTELEVVIDGGVAVVRRETDDQATGELPGGRARALFIIAPDGPQGRWRIHSVVPLRLLDEPEAEESNP
ncbi:MAG: hypothetical protein OEV40_18470 [Acidimicrobiia bacterium]|nr:hypothetical protein [Acidimicrobiia bacterium]